MAVEDTTTIASAGLFVPYRTAMRAGMHRTEPVGTLFIRGTVTGAAGGGTAIINISMAVQEFGFHAIWVPTTIVLQDSLASLEGIIFQYDDRGNERLATDIIEHVTPTTINSQQRGSVETTGVIIDPNVAGGNVVLKATWQTNTDTKVYIMTAFGPIWDGQVMAREGGVPEAFSGLT